MSDEQDGAGAEDELARSDREWAAQAEAYPAAAGVLGGTAAGGPTAGAGTAGGAPRSADRPKGPKPVRGPSGNAIGWLRGLGLLSILLTIGIMALLSWRILSDTGGGDVDVVRGEAPAAEAPGAATSPTDVPDGAQLGEGGSTDRAEAAACEMNRATAETAVRAYEAMYGSAPTDLQQVIDEGLLIPDGEFEVEIRPDGSVVSTGTCAGG